jgi:hypothetical protein
VPIHPGIVTNFLWKKRTYIKAFSVEGQWSWLHKMIQMNNLKVATILFLTHSFVYYIYCLDSGRFATPGTSTKGIYHGNAIAIADA